MTQLDELRLTVRVARMYYEWNMKQSEIAKLIDDAGPVAGLFVLVLGIVLFFLWRSMSRQLKRIDPSLPAGPDQREQELDRERTERALERGADDGPTPQ